MNGELIVSDLLQNEKLEHSGVKGQKWGVRRWQNEDGTLTPEGRIHYGLKPQYANMTEKEMRDAMARKKTQDDYVRMMTKSASKRKDEISNLIKTLGDTTEKGVKLTKAGMIANVEREISETTRTMNAIKANASEQNRELTKDEKSNLDALNKANQQNSKAIKDIESNMNLINEKVVKPAASTSGSIADFATKKQMSDLKSQALQNISEMDEKQLKSVVDRMLLEQQYEDLLNPPKPSKLEKGREIFQTMGALMGLVLTGLGIATAIKQLTAKTPAAHSEDLGEYLEHYGVRGMKKGIRRWTNPDGSLTEEGKIHYGLVSKGKAERDLRDTFDKEMYNRMHRAVNTGERDANLSYNKYKKASENDYKIRELTRHINYQEKFVSDLLKLRKDIRLGKSNEIREYTDVKNLNPFFTKALSTYVVFDNDGNIADIGDLKYGRLGIELRPFGPSKAKVRQSDESDEYLAHYGVKGMKKGDRRWQNEDGSLTPAGYIHYGIDPNKERKQQIKMDRQARVAEAKTAVKVQKIADKQELKERAAAKKQDLKIQKEEMAAKRKNVMKVIVGTAAVAGVAAVGYHWLHQQSLDNQLLRDLEFKKQEGKQILAQLNVEKKAEITMAKAKMMEAKGNVLEKLQSNSGTVIANFGGKTQVVSNTAEKGKAILKNVNKQKWWQKIKQFL